MGKLAGLLGVSAGGPYVSSALVIHANIAVYALAYWMTLSLLPFLTKELGVDVVVFGYLQTAFSLVQLIGGPLMGRVCDSYGSRVGLQASQLGSGLAYILLGTAASVPALFASRVPTLLMHTMHCCQTFMATVSSVETRSVAMSRLTISYGLGQVAGSALGGRLSEYVGNQGVALIAGSLCLLMTLVNQVFVTGPPPAPPAPGRSSSLDLSRLLSLLSRNTKLALFLTYSLVLSLGVSLFTSQFPLLMQEQYNLTKSELGDVHAISATVGVIFGAIILPQLIRSTILGVYVSEKRLLVTACVLFMFCLPAIALSSTLSQLYVILVPFAGASAVLYTIASAVVTQLVAIEDAGTAIGFSHASRSLCGIVSPVTGAYLVSSYGYGVGAGYVPAALCGCAMTILLLIGPVAADAPSASKAA